MSDFVLDCSVTMAWCFEDESRPSTDAVLDRLGKGEALVPALWPLEVANALLAAERMRRLTKAQSLRFVQLLHDLPIVIDDGTAIRAMGSTMTLAREQQLSTYDAAYLDLAIREGLPLATQDASLRRAAKRCGVAVM